MDAVRIQIIVIVEYLINLCNTERAKIDIITKMLSTLFERTVH